MQSLCQDNRMQEMRAMLSGCILRSFDRAYPGHRISADMTTHFGPPAGIILASESTKELHFVGMPPGTILLTLMSINIQCQRKRPWQQNEVSRKGLPCAAAFACTDYKVQGRTSSAWR